MPGWLEMGCGAVNRRVLSVEKGGSKRRRRKVTRIPTKIIYTIYVFASEEKQTYGVIVIIVHLRGRGHWWVVTVGWHLAHHIVIITLHVRKWRRRSKGGEALRCVRCRPQSFRVLIRM